MIGPETCLAFGRLLPPAVRIDDVHTAVTVDVSRADAVAARRSRLADRRREPGSGWIRRIRLRVLQNAARADMHEIGLAVAIDVLHHADLADARHHVGVDVPATSF